MYGLVVFYYRWDAFLNQGHVRFILTGQKCNQCERSAFETPMWYPEEAQKVNLSHIRFYNKLLFAFHLS